MQTSSGGTIKLNFTDVQGYIVAAVSWGGRIPFVGEIVIGA